jgi:CheY-like chemotaxis protein
MMTGRARILVVEDDPASRLLVRDILTFRGHEVIEAGSAEEARARFLPRPDLILMDLLLPGEEGGKLLVAEIRNHPDLASVPVIAVTASAMSGDRERLLRAGFDGYMSKPIDTRAFGFLVEAHLGKARCAT